MKKGFFIFLFLLVLPLLFSACTKKTSKLLAGWPVYESKQTGIRFSYQKDLAYKIDYNQTIGEYELYLGFSNDEEVIKNNHGDYPLEFVIVSEEKESEYVNGNKYVSGFKKGNKFYYFSTTEMDKYGETIDKMAESLEFVD